MTGPARILPLGDAAWTVEFGNAVAPALHARVMGYARRLAGARAAGELPGVVEWVPTFRSVTVHFDPLAADADALGDRLLRLAQEAEPEPAYGRRLRIPVLFGAEAGPDLADVAAASGLGEQTVVERMTASVFKVYLLGFMPGFPYLGGLPAELSMPRLATPRVRVPERTLAIAGTTCGIYPFASPGGWRLVGRTPLRLFDPGRPAAPTLFEPGDEVVWHPIEAQEYAELDARAIRGELPWEACCVPEGEPWPA